MVDPRVRHEGPRWPAFRLRSQREQPRHLAFRPFRMNRIALAAGGWPASTPVVDTNGEPPMRPVSVVFLDIGSLRLGEPNELDTVHLAAGYQAARYRFFYASAERLASRVRLLLFGPVRRVLSVKLPSHQFDVAGEHFGPIQEWPDVLSAIPGGQTWA
jgi:hypothetical protein